MVKLMVTLNVILSDNPDEGDIKLYYNARSSDYYKGILQIWLNGQWGTVSNKYWTMDNVDTVCRQLGRDGTYSLAIVHLYDSKHYFTVMYKYSYIYRCRRLCRILQLLL